MTITCLSSATRSGNHTDAKILSIYRALATFLYYRETESQIQQLAMVSSKYTRLSTLIPKTQIGDGSHFARAKQKWFRIWVGTSGDTGNGYHGLDSHLTEALVITHT